MIHTYNNRGGSGKWRWRGTTYPPVVAPTPSRNALETEGPMIADDQDVVTDAEIDYWQRRAYPSILMVGAILMMALVGLIFLVAMTMLSSGRS